MGEFVDIEEIIVSLGIWGYVAVINIITFAAFGVDKLKAMAEGWRISEKALLSLSVFGGASGGWIAMQIFRHKTKKPVFKYGLPVMILLHIAVLKLFLFV